MTKLLNLDELSTNETKVIKFKGVEHVAVELTVQGYIDRVKRSKEVDATDSSDANLARAMDLINEVFPTLTADILGDVPLIKMQAIMEFALAAPEDIARAAEKASSSDVSGNV